MLVSEVPYCGDVTERFILPDCRSGEVATHPRRDGGIRTCNSSVSGVFRTPISGVLRAWYFRPDASFDSPRFGGLG